MVEIVWDKRLFLTFQVILVLEKVLRILRVVHMQMKTSDSKMLKLLNIKS